MPRKITKGRKKTVEGIKGGSEPKVAPEKDDQITIKCKSCGREMKFPESRLKNKAKPFCPHCGITITICALCNSIVFYGVDHLQAVWIEGEKRTAPRSRYETYPSASDSRSVACRKCITKLGLVNCVVCNFVCPPNKLAQVTGFNGKICPHCAENITVCYACRQVVSKRDCEDGSLYCKRCTQNKKSGGYLGINGAGFRPIPQFFGGDTPPHYGIELEVDVGAAEEARGNYSHFLLETCVTELGEIIKKEQAFYLKSDGSLKRGFELVSQPHTIDAWRNQTWLKTACEIVKENHGSSFNTKTCGVHVHRSRGDLTDLHTTNLIVLFVRLQPFFERVAQRKENGYCHYAFFQDGNKGRRLNGNVIYKAVKEKHGSIVNRYQALNLTPPATIECRIFKGTLCHGSVLSYILFMHWLCEFAKQKSTVLGKLLRYSVVDLWNMVAEFFSIDPMLTAFLEEKKVLLKGINASKRVVPEGFFSPEEIPE